jgi:hypothetical protein
MRRLRRFAWLLWLLIALVPLRGIAMSAFVPVAETAPPAAVIEQPPCPMHATPHDVEPTPANACTLCDVCHLVAMPVAEIDAASGSKPQAAPLPSLGLGAGRALAGGLFRPPR